MPSTKLVRDKTLEAMRSIATSTSLASKSTTSPSKQTSYPSCKYQVHTVKPRQMTDLREVHLGAQTLRSRKVFEIRDSLQRVLSGRKPAAYLASLLTPLVPPFLSSCINRANRKRSGKQELLYSTPQKLGWNHLRYFNF